ncbi:MAG: hypothetical protein IKF42_12250, partial [Mogibacterium sp.]|nr:hypothetical protein [Mogibacterium sp.]
MKKLLTIVLSLVLILDVAPVFAYAAGSSNPADDVKAASEKLAEVKAKLEQAQKAYDEYIKEDPQIEEKYMKAQSAASEAEEALRKAETELASAHAAYESAESIYQEKVSAQEKAKSEYESALQTKEDKTDAKEKAAAALAEAQEAYDSYVDSISDDPDIRNASNELKAAKEAVEVAEAKVQEKTEALAAANAEAADAKAAKDAADNKVINARAAEKPYEDAVNKATAAVDAAQTEKEAADTAVDNAQAEYDNVSQAVTDKEAEIKETEQRISAAENNLAAAESAKVKAQADIAAAESAKTKAQADKKEAEAAIAEYQTSAEEKLNAKDFFVWLSENEDQSAAVRESAAVAARMLSNQVTSADLSKIQNDGTVSSSSSSKTYAEIIGNTHIGQEGDATYWDNFKYALTLAGKGNEYRAKESLSALKISSVMMAMGEINANYQRSISGISHSSAFLALENLAYNSGGQGTSAGYPDPVFKEYDPFDGWYTREKKVYDYLVEKGWNVDVSKLTSDQKNTVKTELGLSELSDVQTGHYMTLTDRNGGTKMISSGFGYVNQVSKYMDGGFY